ncbi:glycosyltransferase [Roseibium polysiphoniae]|uniref:Glycosyltransferase n=1 Tax=Roseibium polysiphoniae TaxID=2571221 RepID=A0A944GU19_9HYPH|nr:glycosyltransferase family 4 protein [Roseibium polysiphoniae]MBS8262403.1 glycosyltransferase [Roseibium polysiphoniae]
MNVDPERFAQAEEICDLSKVKVVHIVRQFVPMIGGLEDFVRNLVRSQYGRFESVKVVTLNRLFTDLDQTLPAQDMVDGVEVIRIPFSGSTRYPIAPRVFAHLTDADLIHVHAVDFFFDALALGRLLHGHKMVATTHGGFFHTTAHSRLKRTWFNSVTRLSARQYEEIACCSRSDLSLFQTIAPNGCRLIENGVDLSKFSGASSELPQKRLVTIGRFSANKRLDRVLDVLKVLVEKDHAWQLEIIGSASDLSQADLYGLIADRGLQDNAQVWSGLSDVEIGQVLANCSLFVSASDYEGFGIAMIEALSAGLIPVVHPNRAFQSLASQHPQVHLSDFGDARRTAIEIEEVLEHLERSPILRFEAKKSAQQHGWQATSAEYDKMYRSALGN